MKALRWIDLIGPPHARLRRDYRAQVLLDKGTAELLGCPRAVGTFAPGKSNLPVLDWFKTRQLLRCGGLNRLGAVTPTALLLLEEEFWPKQEEPFFPHHRDEVDPAC